MALAQHFQAEATSRREQVQALIADNELGHGFKRLLDYARDFSEGRESENEAVALLSAYNRALDERRRNTSEQEKFDAKVTNLIASALQLVDRVYDLYTGYPLPSPSQPSPRPTLVEPTLVEPTLVEPTLVQPTAPPAGAPTPRPNLVEAQPRPGCVPPRSQVFSFEAAREKFRNERYPLRKLPDAVFCCKDLRKRFGKAPNAFQLSKVSLCLKLREITGVVGVNGVGKTTLLRIIAGELAASSGEFCYPALDGGTLNWQSIRDQIAYVQQSPERWPGRLLDNLHLHASFHGLQGRDNVDEAEFLLERLGLSSYRDKRWDEISGGFKMRFELAKALIARPKLLVLDEPLAPLDVLSQQLFLRDLRELADSLQSPLAVIVSSQHLYEIEAISDTLLVLNDGAPVYCGPGGGLGADRTTNLFEFRVSSISFDALYQAFAGLDGLRLVDAGFHYTARVSCSVTSADVLERLRALGKPVSYFRDISCSLRMLFEDFQKEE
jgi:ABC-2 type transport system ATP-binding protein